MDDNTTKILTGLFALLVAVVGWRVVVNFRRNSNNSNNNNNTVNQKNIKTKGDVAGRDINKPK